MISNCTDVWRWASTNHANPTITPRGDDAEPLQHQGALPVWSCRQITLTLHPGMSKTHKQFACARTMPTSCLDMCSTMRHDDTRVSMAVISMVVIMIAIDLTPQTAFPPNLHPCFKARLQDKLKQHMEGVAHVLSAPPMCCGAYIVSI